MPEYNLDDKSLFETVTFTIDGVRYSLLELTHEQFDEISNLDTIAKQFSRFTGTKLGDCEKVNYRKMAAAISLILNLITQGAREAGDLIKKKESKPS